MAKRLYSLMLNEQVVNAVDREAHRLGTNRSALIDSVLADCFGVATSQKLMSDIFREMEQLLSSSEELVPFFAPNTGSFYVKSALAYKYRPTLKYELIANRHSEDSPGEIVVNFRTQSAQLLAELERFFKLWVEIESQVLSPAHCRKIDYALYSNRFLRSVVLAENANYSAGEIARAFSAYVNLLDASLKAYINSEKDEKMILNDYVRFVKQSNIVL